MNCDTGNKKEIKRRSYKKPVGIILLILLIAALALFVFISKTIYPQTDETIIREAAAKIVNKEPNDLTNEDFTAITQLIISGERCDISSLKKFTNLEELYLPSLRVPKPKRPNWITSLILRYHIKLPERKYVDLSPIKKLSKLKKIDLSGASVKDISPLKGLTNLEHLDIIGTQISDISPLRKLTKLKILYMWGTEVSNLEPINNFENLEILYANYTKISDLEPLRKLTKLKTLLIASTQVFDIEPLKELKNLQELELYNTKISDFEPLNNLINLKKLTIDGTQLSNLVKGLPELESLTLIKPDVENIEYLKEFTNIKHVSLIDSEKITDSQIEDIEKAIPDLNISRVLE